MIFLLKLWFIILPLGIIIHELGHAFFVKLFGGTIKIVIGSGKKMFNLWIFEIHAIIFKGGACYYKDLKIHNKTVEVFISLGGVIFNFMAFFISIFLLKIVHTKELIYFKYVNLAAAIYNLLPIKEKENNLDGMCVIKTLKRNHKIKN